MSGRGRGAGPASGLRWPRTARGPRRPARAAGLGGPSLLDGQLQAARSSSSPAGVANGPVAAALSFIAVSPGDRRRRRGRARHRGARTRASTPRRRGGAYRADTVSKMSCPGEIQPISASCPGPQGSRRLRRPGVADSSCPHTAPPSFSAARAHTLLGGPQPAQVAAPGRRPAVLLSRCLLRERHRAPLFPPEAALAAGRRRATGPAWPRRSPRSPERSLVTATELPVVLYFAAYLAQLGGRQAAGYASAQAADRVHRYRGP